MRFPGIIPAAITPFDADGTVDVPALEANVRALVDAGVHGIVATGTMGEASSLTLDERRTVVEAIVRVADGRIPVVVGASSSSTASSVAYARLGAEAGADAVMLLPPLNYGGDDRELASFYAAVADGAGLPIMAYNNPGASGVDLTADVVARLGEQVDAVVAVKECSGDARRIPALLHATDLEILVGGDDWALEGFATGATGWVTGVANVAPAECVALYDAVQAGSLDEARGLYRRMLPLARLDMTPKLVQYFKGAMDAVGLAGGPSRPPRLPLTAAEQQILDAAMTVLQGERLAA
jgi:4-hydroxy-tetrahydrodipicolinate synthase